MDPKLTEQLQQTLASLLANAQDAAAWTKGQIPLLVQEKIALGRVEETVSAIAWFIVGAGLIYVALRFWKESWQITADMDAPTIMLNILGLIGGLIAIMPNHQFMLVWFAPRLYIVEWLMAQVHK